MRYDVISCSRACTRLLHLLPVLQAEPKVTETLYFQFHSSFVADTGKLGSSFTSMFLN